MAQCPLAEEEVVSRCLVVQHVEPEGSYAIGAALSQAGVALETCRVFAGDPVPTDLSGFDGVVVMGGPMSANSRDGFPSRDAEVELLADAVEGGIPTLGICLGAQLLALAVGGAVLTGSAGAEIGWGSVDLTAAAGSDPLVGGLPSQLTVLHWHGDTFGLPAGATHLASSGLYANQAFRVGGWAWGLQFHIEVDGHAVGAFLDVFGDEARDAGGDPDVIEGQTASCLDALGPVRDRIAARFAGLVSGLDRDRYLIELG